MNKILHLFQDSPITDQLIENLGMVDSEHLYLILYEDIADVKWIKSINEQVLFFNSKEEDINDLILKYSIKAILIHGMFSTTVEVVSKIHADLKIGWFVWGADMYHLPKIYSSLYAPRTKRFIFKDNFKFFLSKSILKHEWLREVVYKFLTNRDDVTAKQISVIKRSSFFITYMKEEFDFYSRYYPNNLIFAHANFNTIGQYLGGNKELRIHNSASNVLVGNSNTLENNHLDTFAQLKKKKHLDPEALIIVPLSYGDNLKYRKKLIRKGAELFGRKFLPLLDFTERIKYIEILQSCSCAIFYHFRQQAMGNIISLLFMGSRVYLSSKNPAFEYLTRIGVVIFDFDKDFSVFGNKKLDFESSERNRLVLERLFSKDNVISHLKGLSEILRR